MERIIKTVGNVTLSLVEFWPEDGMQDYYRIRVGDVQNDAPAHYCPRCEFEDERFIGTAEEFKTELFADIANACRAEAEIATREAGRWDCPDFSRWEKAEVV